jgi:hypothetical protein
VARVVAYHPGLGRTAEVDEDAMPQLRQSGWILNSENEANKAQAAKAADKKSSGKAADKTEEK